MRKPLDFPIFFGCLFIKQDKKVCHFGRKSTFNAEHYLVDHLR